MTATTFHARMVKESVETILRDQPEMASALYDALAGLRSGFYTKAFVDFVLQKRGYPHTAYAIEDAYPFSKWWVAAMQGDVGLIQIEVGAVPFADRMIAENAAALSRLPHPFSATFYGEKESEDGWLEWSEPIAMVRNLPDGKGGFTREKVIVGPGKAPLEVGTTSASRSLLHLLEDRGLARWPYGHEKITIGVKLGNDPFEGIEEL